MGPKLFIEISCVDIKIKPAINNNIFDFLESSFLKVHSIKLSQEDLSKDLLKHLLLFEY